VYGNVYRTFSAKALPIENRAARKIVIVRMYLANCKNLCVIPSDLEGKYLRLEEKAELLRRHANTESAFIALIFGGLRRRALKGRRGRSTA
jgi:hypothetical protein